MTDSDTSWDDPLDGDDLESWLRESDPPGELAVPAAAWDSAVETAFDPSHEPTEDLTAAPGPDPLDEESADGSPDPELAGFEDDLGADPGGDDTFDNPDVFGTDDDVSDESFGDTTFDDSSLGDDF
ncbi:hypothetical protein RD149_21375 [Gordonia westfalica]|uniref:Uncharacterized protein n=1 Tax=Gordonia westfalica TaxID=158898 RepID=A0ABU2GXV7_9ACTN|nr:hypothetical protein [Gordonia westfalica]MDS1116298.1 hypothetical protein [Gordonia westfalica]